MKSEWSEVGVTKNKQSTQKVEDKPGLWLAAGYGYGYQLWWIRR